METEIKYGRDLRVMVDEFYRYVGLEVFIVKNSENNYVYNLCICILLYFFYFIDSSEDKYVFRNAHTYNQY